MSSSILEKPVKKPVKRFKLLDGFAIHPDPKTGVDRTYEPNEVIESEGDLTYLNVPGFRPKYELVPEKGEVLPQGAFAFDPSKETLEQFADRMRSVMQIGPGAPAVDADADAE